MSGHNPVASTSVLATGLCPDAGALFHVGDRRGQVGGGVDQMVNQHVIPRSVEMTQGNSAPRRGAADPLGHEGEQRPHPGQSNAYRSSEGH
jgi:hypothetical protein